MAVPAAMRRRTQYVAEATPGAGGTVNKSFSSFGLEPSMNPEVATVTPRGQTAPTKGWIAWEDSSFSIEGGVLSYDEIDPVLQGLKKVSATTVAVAGKERIFELSQTESVVNQTFKIEVGDPGAGVNRGGTALNCAVNEFGFEVSSGSPTVELNGGFIGGKLTDGTMTAAVAQTDFKPVLPQHVTITHADTAAGLSSGTALTNAFTVNFNIADIRSVYRFLGNATGDASGSVETVPDMSFTLTIADEASPSDDFMTKARAGQPKFFRVKFEGENIPGTTPTTKYLFQLDLCAVLADGPSFTDEQEVWAREFPFSPAFDPTWNHIFQIKTINLVA